MASTLLASGSTPLTNRNALVQSQYLRWRNCNSSSSVNNLTFTHPLKLNPVKRSLKCTAKTPSEPKSGSDYPNRIREGLEIIMNAFEEESEKIAHDFVDALLTSDPDSSWPDLGGLMDGLSSSLSSSSSESNSARSSSAQSVDNLFEKLNVEEVLALLVSVMFLGYVVDLTCKPSHMNAPEKTSVLKLQVGLLGMAKSLQRDLDSIAEAADTSTRDGLSYILTETMVALLRHPDYCTSAYSSVDVKTNAEEGEKQFNLLSIEERGKFDEETLQNVNNMRRHRPTSLSVSGLRNEYIVITILVAAQGDHMLPTIEGSKDLKDALQMLGSIPSSQIRAVEVLWTPQAENDTLSRGELLEDYPLLRAL